MPWTETCAMDERLRLVAAYMQGDREMAELCREFGVSRKTAYKWVDRYKEFGVVGLEERSRAPHTSPHSTPEEVEKLLLELRRRKPTWGPKKLRAYLEKERPGLRLPVLSTIAAILSRNGLTAPRRRRTRVPRYCTPFFGIDAPNAVWSADYKGQFPMGDGRLCYPFTLTDNFSRYILRCVGLPNPTHENTQPVLEAAFREFGLPLALRTDNGPPFAATGLVGLTRLGVWLLKLGVVHERIEPGHPEQNGRHERMHRTLAAETTSPPRDCLGDQQRAFNAFTREFNDERPHEALGQATPSSVYEPAQRSMPEVAPEPEYGPDHQVRRVTTNGTISLDDRRLHVSHALEGETVGVREHADGVWVVRFAFRDLGVFDFRHGAKDKLKLRPLPPELSWDPREWLAGPTPGQAYGR